VAGKKDNDFGLYSNVCQDIIQEKSSEIIKMLNTLGERLTILVEFSFKEIFLIIFLGEDC